MRNKEEDLLNEIHEMRNLMEYMDSEVLSENVSNAEIRQNAKAQAKDTDTSGIENVREKEMIAALQDMINKIKGEGNQYGPKVKKYTELLYQALSEKGGVNEEEMNENKITDDVISKYNIEALVDKILANEKGRIDRSLIPMLFADIGEKLKFKKKK